MNFYAKIAKTSQSHWFNIFDGSGLKVAYCFEDSNGLWHFVCHDPEFSLHTLHMNVYDTRKNLADAIELCCYVNRDSFTGLNEIAGIPKDNKEASKEADKTIKEDEDFLENHKEALKILEEMVNAGSRFISKERKGLMCIYCGGTMTHDPNSCPYFKAQKFLEKSS